MTYRFDDRVAVITGAGRGLGRDYALLLASLGAKVVVNDPGAAISGENIDAGPAHEVVQEIRVAGGEAVACVESVATAEGGRKIIQAALDNYGRIDILIHNAGNNRYASLSEMSYDDFDAVLDVHLRGAFHVVRPAFPLMCEAEYGRIVLTSSIGGIYGNANVANYAASKAGMIGLSNVAAIEGADHGVRSNVIIPAALTRLAEGLDTSAYPPMVRNSLRRSSGGSPTNPARPPAKCTPASPDEWRKCSSPRPPVCTGRPGRSTTSPRTSTQSVTPAIRGSCPPSRVTSTTSRKALR